MLPDLYKTTQRMASGVRTIRSQFDVRTSGDFLILIDDRLL